MTASRSTQIRIYIYIYICFCFCFFVCLFVCGGGGGISDAQIGLLSDEARRSMHMEIFVHFLRYIFVFCLGFSFEQELRFVL